MYQYKIYHNYKYHYFTDLIRAMLYAKKVEDKTGKRLAINKTYKLINKIKRHETNKL